MVHSDISYIYPKIWKRKFYFLNTSQKWPHILSSIFHEKWKFLFFVHLFANMYFRNRHIQFNRTWLVGTSTRRCLFFITLIVMGYNVISNIFHFFHLFAIINLILFIVFCFVVFIIFLIVFLMYWFYQWMLNPMRCLQVFFKNLCFYIMRLRNHPFKFILVYLGFTIVLMIIWFLYFCLDFILLLFFSLKVFPVLVDYKFGPHTNFLKWW